MHFFAFRFSRSQLAGPAIQPPPQFHAVTGSGEAGRDGTAAGSLPGQILICKGTVGGNLWPLGGTESWGVHGRSRSSLSGGARTETYQSISAASL